MANCSSARHQISFVVRTSIFAGLLLSCVAYAQDATNELPKKSDAEPVPMEVFQGPQFKKVIVPSYPRSELDGGVEGWVNVGFMVDRQGKPYELTVVSSSGDNKGLKKAALHAVEDWTFEPATLNGDPIDSSLSRKIIFKIRDNELGASAQFVRAYKELQKAIAANDKISAESALAKLKVQNLYEDAYYGVAQHAYAALWGNTEQQLAGARRAVAGEDTAKYLPKDLFIYALQQQLRLELQTQDFASALLFTWPKLEKAGVDNAVLDKFRPTIDKVRALKKDNRPYKLSAHLEEGSWNYLLFKRRFRIDVTEGRLSQIKLRCNKKYVFFQYDAAVEYQTAEKYGMCSLEVVGDGNSKFELTQM